LSIERGEVALRNFALLTKCASSMPNQRACCRGKRKLEQAMVLTHLCRWLWRLGSHREQLKTVPMSEKALDGHAKKQEYATNSRRRQKFL
jgi:hypothetical protein